MESVMYLKPEEVILDASQVLQDKGLTQGWYMGQVQRALTALAFDNLFDKQVVSHATVPTLDLPVNLFNIRRILLYDGDECIANKATKVYHKENFYRISSGSKGFGDNNWGNEEDYLQDSMGGRDWNRDRFDATRRMGSVTSPPESLYYYNRVRNKLFLSDTCLRWPRVQIEYNGIGIAEWGKVPMIPLWLREAVVDFIILRGCERLIRQDPKGLGTLMKMKYDAVHGSSGTWAEARIHMNGDTKEHNDLTIYLSNLGR